uniref:Uncharacterized protein n=1 Tax=viral metagenome TaxID=1070528 RepID=A0A6C0LYW3_9ZZZZ
MKRSHAVWIVLVFAAAVISTYWFIIRPKKTLKNEQYCGECSAGNIDDTILNNASKDTSQLPIFKPEFNFREGAKQLILLEDHLFNRRKFCLDCCKKHALAAEGLFEEAMSLDTERKYEDICNDLPNRIRDVIKKLGRMDAIELGDEVRAIRKPIHVEFADKF